MKPLGRIAIVMSRLPRLIEPQHVWLGALRATLRRALVEADGMVTSDGTAGVDFVRRGAKRLGLRDERLSEKDFETPASLGVVDSIPVQDRLQSDCADTVFALGIRANGHIHHLLRERLQRGGRVILVDCPGLQLRSVSDEFTSSGATVWQPDPADLVSLAKSAQERTETDVDLCSPFSSPTQRAVCEIVPIPTADEWMFLSHTTRACPGPWPGQEVTEYLDALLDGTMAADHSAAGTLARIVQQKKLIASGSAIRGGHRVVCLTAVPLRELPALRRFRTHRTRWDFEPFGLCLHRDWLESSGARPVIYGDEDVWQSLKESERPWFQLSNLDQTGDANAEETHIDWSAEREWRHLGDIDLNQLPGDAGLVFVPDYATARRVSAFSPWPITLWSG